MAGEGTGDDKRATEWQRLNEVVAELRLSIGRTTDRTQRERLLQQLTDTREAIIGIEAALDRSPALSGAAGEAPTAGSSDDDIGELLDSLTWSGDRRANAPGATDTLIRPELRPILRPLLAVTLLLNAAYVLSLVLIDRSPDGYSTLWDGWIYHIATTLPAALVVLRALTDSRHRWAWWLLSLGILLNTGGNLLYTYHDQNLDPVPFPAWSDVPYLESYLAFAVALVIVTQYEVANASRAMRLNGLVIGLAAAAVAVALWFESILEQSGSTLAVLVGLAYPLFDLVFIVVALSGLTPVRYRPSTTSATFIVGALVFALGDIVYLRQLVGDGYVAGTMLEATWVGGILLFGVAPWMPRYQLAAPASRPTRSPGAAIVPWVAAAASLAVIAVSVGRDTPDLAVLLAIASIAAVLGRIGLTIRELRRANEAFSQAWISDLIGLEDPAPAQPAPAQPAAAQPARSGAGAGPAPSSIWLVALGTIAVTALVGVGILIWQVGSGQTDLEGETATATTLSEPATAPPAAPPAQADDTSAQEAEQQPTTIAGQERQAALQRDLDRLLAFTPIVFAPGQSELDPLQTRVLNNVAALLLSYPEIEVRVIGYTDQSGAADINTSLSSDRAEAVRDYLISQGVGQTSLRAEGRGEATATGSADLAGLERRVEFEVVGVGAPAAPTGALRVGLVAPSAANDLAFTQSMVDAMNIVAGERALELTVADNIFVEADAAAAAQDLADSGHDVVIVHGPQFGSFVPALARQFPAITFAWGTAADAPVQPNVYTYTAAAEQGGYVFGSLAASMTSGRLGVIGPIETGDAKRYIDGFRAGARQEAPEVEVDVTYIGSFLDSSLAAETATNQLDGGADHLTGTGPMVVGAVSVAAQRGVPWFANQADQATLAPASVVAAQVYHWEVALRQILADRDSGLQNGRLLTLDLANGGLTIVFNPGRPTDPVLVQRSTELVAGITDGSIDLSQIATS